ncbi:MAG: S9 family peptidase [Bacteroidetes bacterium]|nr:S9 family peptidase [Bacteroidota bacterium]HET6244313.1 prolyl oligopeptidase family serine peptidase [Bacteroidia bacterium]
MKKNIFLPILFVAAIACNEKEKNETPSLVYPLTVKTNQSDTYFGTVIQDPYRWLEDDNSEETAEWVKAQNEVTFNFLSTIPFRNKIKDRLTEVWNFAKYSTPFKESGKYYFYKNDGIQNQSVLYVQDSLTSEPRVLIDPNKFSQDGTSALTNFTISNNGKYAAYGISKAGSDWKEFFVMDLKTGENLSDHIKWVKFSGTAWKGDGFYYTRYDVKDEKHLLSEKNEFPKVYYHKIGELQEKDVLIHGDNVNALRGFYAGVTEDEKFIYLSETETTSGNALYFKKSDSKTGFIKIADGFVNDYNVIDNINEDLLILTNDNAPRYRLIRVDTKNPGRENWKEVIPQNQDVLQRVEIANGKIIANYMKDVSTRLYCYTLDGTFEKEITLPGLGIVNSFSGKKDESVSFFSFSTFTAPTIIYKYDLNSGVTEIFRKPEVNFNHEEYETAQVFYPSKDGTKIPMFITHKKGIKLDGKNPVMLYGYGGFNISVTPGFKVENTVFLENGGIYAVANIRGGGEYGKDWHNAGTQLKKQNVFDDFIAAAEYLINQKYTSADKLAISGRSNGGLLVGAAITQRPDLFKVAIPGVGVLDMLRYHTFTIGYAWATDYGKSDDEIQFKNLLKYSPLHNVNALAYPATLVITGDHDDRVVPAHSFKFIAELQEKQTGKEPVLIRIDVNAGHGAGKPVSKQIDEAADTWAFIFHHLGMEVK